VEEQVHLSRSGRPIDRQTNVLTEMQARNTHIVCTDPCLHEVHGFNLKETWGRSIFWAQWFHILGQCCLE